MILLKLTILVSHDIYHNLKEILSFERMEDAIRDATEYECTQIKRLIRSKILNQI